VNKSDVERPLKLVFLGGGLNSAIGRMHFISSQLDRKFEVVGGFFSRDKLIQESTESYYKIDNPIRFESFDNFAAKKDLFDAIVILTPTPLHYEAIEFMVKENIPIICEKAFVSNFNESKKVLDLLGSKPVKNLVTFNYTGFPMVRLMQHMVINGEIGKPVNIRIAMPQEGFVKINSLTGKVNLPQPWRRKDGEVPTVLLDLAVHCLHLGSFITNQNPSEVFARFKHHSQVESVIDDVEVLAEYPSEMLGSFWFTKSALGKQNGLSVEIYGTEGSLTWVQEFPNSLTFADKYGDIRVLKFGQNLPIVNEARYERFKPGHPSGFTEAFANLYWDAATYLMGDSYNLTDTGLSPSMQVASKGFDIIRSMVESNITSTWRKVMYSYE
jgi:predicted dehydrogenase